MKCLAYSRYSESRQQALGSCSESEWIKISLIGHITIVWSVCAHLCVHVRANVSIGCRPQLLPTLSKLEHNVSATVAGQQAPGISSPPLQGWDKQTLAVMAAFCEAVGDLNPGPHAGVSNSFLTAPPPQPSCFTFSVPLYP